MGEQRRSAGVHPVIPCRFDLSAAEATREQERLRPLVRRERLAMGGVRLVAGCDCAIAGDRICAAVLVLAVPGARGGRDRRGVVAGHVPLCPGLLSFRELPALLAAFATARTRPDAVLCDGQGIAHPRRSAWRATSACCSICRRSGAPSRG